MSSDLRKLLRKLRELSEYVLVTLTIVIATPAVDGMQAIIDSTKLSLTEGVNDWADTPKRPMDEVKDLAPQELKEKKKER